MKRRVKVDSTKLNVVIIVLDTVRQDHLSCYGYERRTTPNIDAIAEAGLLFRQATATSCWTLPSHASLFTGLYPSRHRADFDSKYLADDHLTLAGFLRRSGYQTVCISCNGLVSEHTNLTAGFDQAYDVMRLYGDARGFIPRFVQKSHKLARRWFGRDRGAQKATHLALRWLKQRDETQPFFLFMNYMDCHLPYQLRRAERHEFVPMPLRQRVDAVPQDPFAVMAGHISMTPQELDDLIRLYDGCLHYLDRQVGWIYAWLGQAGLIENTIFVVTSDHGESFGEHGLMDHQYGLYEHLLRVPLVVRLPEGVASPREVDQIVQLTDIFPTLVPLIAPSSTLNGLPEWQGIDIFGQRERQVAFGEYLIPNTQALERRFPTLDLAPFRVAMRSVRLGEEKLIWRDNGRLECYNLTADPGELQNLAAGNPEQVDALHQVLQDSLGLWPPLEAIREESDFTQVIEERLRALGYL